MANNTLDINSLLSRHDLLNLSMLEDNIIHIGDFHALYLIGVDSLDLDEAFAEFIRAKSPIPVKRHDSDAREMASGILKNAERLDNQIFHIFSFFNYPVLSAEQIAANLIFYRDYIPQFKLKIIIISSHNLLETLIVKAYDFYSIAGFTGFFSDQAQAVRKDLAEYEGKPQKVEEFEKNLENLNNYKKQGKIIDEILLTKLFKTAYSAFEISKFDVSLELSREAFKIAKKIGEKQYTAKIYLNIGLIYEQRGEFKTAQNNYRDALEIAKDIDDIYTQADVMAHMGKIYDDKGQPDKALKLFRKTWEILKNLGDSRQAAVVLGYMGGIYRRQNKHDKAGNCFKEALQMSKKIGYLEGLVSYYLYLASVHHDKEELAESLSYNRKALEIQKKVGDYRGEAEVLGNIGVIFKEKGELENASKYQLKAMEIAEKVGFEQFIARARRNISIIEVPRCDSAATPGDHGIK